MVKTLKARCMKCRDTRKMVNPKIQENANGTFMAKGQCANCGCNMCKIMSRESAMDFSE